MIETQGYLLHQRPYRETSVIAQFFTQEAGLIHAVVRSARGPKRLQTLQPFTCLELGWRKPGDLVTLTQHHPLGPPYPLQDLSLYSAWYLQELLLRFLPKHDPQPQLYLDFIDALDGLAHRRPLDCTLRRFEMRLLEALGYGLPWHQLDQITSPRLVFHPEQGFQTSVAPQAWPREVIIAVCEEHWDIPESRRVAKMLLRQVIDHHLGPTPLRTRDVMQQLMGN